jgi:hypothetical protein
MLRSGALLRWQGGLRAWWRAPSQCRPGSTARCRQHRLRGAAPRQTDQNAAKQQHWLRPRQRRLKPLPRVVSETEPSAQPGVGTTGWPGDMQCGIALVWTGVTEQAYVSGARRRFPSCHPYPIDRASHPFRSRSGLNSNLDPPNRDRMGACDDLGMSSSSSSASHAQDCIVLIRDTSRSGPARAGSRLYMSFSVEVRASIRQFDARTPS